MSRSVMNILLIGVLVVGWYLWPFFQYYAAHTRLNDLRLEESVDAFSKAIESKRLDKDRTHKAYFGRAEARLALAFHTRASDAEIVSAVKDYSDAINIYPENPLYFRNRGTAYSYLGAYDLAFSDFKKLGRLEGDTPIWSLVRKGGLLRRLGEYEEAHKSFQAVLDVWGRPLMPPYYHMALTYKEQGEHHLVIDAIDKGMKAQTDYGSAFKERGCAKAKVGRFDEAVIDYQKGIELDSEWLKEVQTNYPSFKHNAQIEKVEFETLELLANGEITLDDQQVQKLCKQTWWGLYFDKERKKSSELSAE